MADKDDTTTPEETQEEETQTETPEEETDSDEETVSVDVDDEVSEKIASAVIEKLVNSQVAKDTPAKKAPAPAAKVETKDPIESMSKEVRFAKQLSAALKNDQETLRKFNQHAIEKANYQNEGTDADGGYLVPDADFEAEVQRLEEEYGAARKGGIRVTRVNSNALKINKKADGFTFVETAEAGAKSGVKMEFAQVEVVLRKFAAILPWTDELEEDSAVDLFREFTTEFARAKARLEDELVFTDSTSGIVNQSGLIVTAIGGSAWNTTNLDGDDLLNAINSVPSVIGANGAFFMHRNAFNVVRQLKVNAEANNYLVTPDVNGQMRIFGRPVIVTEVLPGTLTTNNETYAIYTDLSRVSRLIEKRGMQLDVLREATIADEGGSTINLARQDMKALRGVYRANHKLVWPGGVAVIGVGTVS